MKNLIYYLIIGALVGVLCAIFEWPITVVWGTLIAFFVFLIGRIFYTVTFSKNVKAIGKFISQQKKDPVYLYLHNIREGSKEEQREALNLILVKYQNTKYEAVYGTALGILNNNFELAKKYNAAILHKEEGQYMDIIIDIMAGEKMQQVPTFKKQWMNKSIEAHKALMQKDKETFDKRVEDTLQASRGIQYYGNYFAFKKLREEL